MPQLKNLALPLLALRRELIHPPVCLHAHLLPLLEAQKKVLDVVAARERRHSEPARGRVGCRAGVDADGVSDDIGARGGRIEFGRGGEAADERHARERAGLGEWEEAAEGEAEGWHCW